VAAAIENKGTMYELYRTYPQPAGGNVDGMEYAKLENAALAHVDDSYSYAAYCGKCKHSARFSLVKLRAHLGDDFPQVRVKERLLCERCGSRHVLSTFLAPNRRGGNLAYLFSRGASAIATSRCPNIWPVSDRWSSSAGLSKIGTANDDHFG
jgi:hypothetical protein